MQKKPSGHSVEGRVFSGFGDPIVFMFSFYSHRFTVVEFRKAPQVRSALSVHFLF